VVEKTHPLFKKTMDDMDDELDVDTTSSSSKTNNNSAGIRDVAGSIFSSNVNIGFIIIAIVALVSSIIGIIQSLSILNSDGDNNSNVKQAERDGNDNEGDDDNDDDDDKMQSSRSTSSSTTNKDHTQHKVFLFMHLGLAVIAIALILGVIIKGRSDANKRKQEALTIEDEAD
jgi:hypothetical protein